MAYYNYYYVRVSSKSDLNSCELENLRKLILEQPFKFYIEVGTGLMGTVCQVAEWLNETNSNCKCIAIDCFEDLRHNIHEDTLYRNDLIHIDDARRLLFQKGLENMVSLHKGDSDIILNYVLEPIQHLKKLVFIDANPSYTGCFEDFKAADKFMVTGDIIIFHDSLNHPSPSYGKSPRNVIENCILQNPRYRLLKLPSPDASPEKEKNTFGIFEVVNQNTRE